MTPADITKCLSVIRGCYPAFQATSEAAEAWMLVLEGQDGARVKRAVLAYCQSGAEWPPSPGQILAAVRPSPTPDDVLAAARLGDGPARELCIAAGAARMVQGVYVAPHPIYDTSAAYGAAAKRVREHLERLNGEGRLQADVLHPGRRVAAARSSGPSCLEGGGAAVARDRGPERAVGGRLAGSRGKGADEDARNA